MQKFENQLAVQSASDAATFIFEDVLDERRRILGQEKVEASPGPNLASTLGNQGSLDEVTAIFEDVLDEKRHILAQDCPRVLSASSNIACMQGSQRKACEETVIFMDVLDERVDILREGHQDAFSTAGHSASPLGHQHEIGEAAAVFENALDERKDILGEECANAFSTSNKIISPLGDRGKLGKITSIFEDPSDEQRYILGEKLSVGDIAATFEDPLDKIRQIIITQHPDAFPPPSNLNLDMRCELCQRITLDVCFRVLEPRTDGQIEERKQYIGYRHQNSFRDLCQSVEAGCDLCKLIKALILESGTDESALLSIEEARENIPVIIRADWYLPGLVRMNGPHQASHLSIQFGLGSSEYKEGKGKLAGDLPVVKIQIFTYPDDYAAEDPRITGRPIALNTNSAACFALINAWLTQCVGAHEGCPDRKPSVLPTRVIDVGPPDGSQEPRIHITGKGETGVYIALSHCWGKKRTLVTTKATLEAMTKQIPFLSVPKTFADAIRVTRRLNIRFLWIDSLCIIQDSGEDWRAESTKMRDVYANSFLTIAAAMATDSYQGFLGKRDGSLVSPIVALGHYPPDSDRKGKVYLRPDSDSWRRTVVEGTLSRRAWTFQERLLSPRILHFGDSQMFFECNSQSASEGYVNVQFNGPGEGGDDRYRFSKRIIHDWEKYEYITFPYPFSRWYVCVEEYTQRNLTNPGDKLVAISGVAREILLRTPVLQDSNPYLAGLWKADILRGLLWIPTRNMALTTADSYRAPSWSWAALEGPITWRYGWLDRLQPGTGALVMQTEVDLQGEDHFGQVRGGSITLRGPIRPGLYLGDREGEPGLTIYGSRLIVDGTEPHHRTYHLFEPTGEEYKWRSFCLCIFDQHPGTENTAFALLRLGNWAPVISIEDNSIGSKENNSTNKGNRQATFFFRPSQPKYCAWALILQEVSPEPVRRWKRVGIATMDPSCIEGWNILDITII